MCLEENALPQQDLLSIKPCNHHINEREIGRGRWDIYFTSVMVYRHKIESNTAGEKLNNLMEIYIFAYPEIHKILLSLAFLKYV